MLDWSRDDAIEVNKTNHLQIIKGTTNEISNLHENDVINGSVVYDETLNKLLFNYGNGANKDFRDLDKNILGMITLHGHNYVNEKWLPCDGRELNRSEYSELYTLIGDTYGSGNGSTTFNIPNLNDNRFIRGIDRDSRRHEKGGSERHTLTVGQIPNHSHAYSTYYNPSYLLNSIPEAGGDEETTTNSTFPTDESHENTPAFISLVYVIKVLA